jgi:hypothetical protein
LFKPDRADRFSRPGAGASRGDGAPESSLDGAWRPRLPLWSPLLAGGGGEGGFGALVEALLPLRPTRSSERKRALRCGSLRSARFVGRAGEPGSR